MDAISNRKLAASVGVLIASLAIVAGGVLTPRRAWGASATDDAEALIREGIRLRGEDQTVRALPLFEKAYQLSPSPRSAGQLGLCELELCHYLAAERHLGEALASPHHPWIAKNRAVLQHQRETAAASIGELALTVLPANAEVRVNDERIDEARLGAPLRLDKGPTDLQIRAAGFEPVRETITIVAGRREQRSFSLVRQPPRSLTAATGVDSGLPAGGGEVPPLQSSPGTELDRSAAAPGHVARGQRIAAWIAGGAAVGALAFGTAEAFNAASKRNDFNDHTGVMGGVSYRDCGTASLSAACKPLKDAYDQAFTLSVVGFAAAGALAITSSVLFVLSSPTDAATRENGVATRAFGCIPDIGARGFGCALHF